MLAGYRAGCHLLQGLLSHAALSLSLHPSPKGSLQVYASLPALPCTAGGCPASLGCMRSTPGRLASP